MKLSVIISTRNRAHAITACLDSIEAAFANASPLDGEIVVVDNGSQDSTAQIIKAWAAANPHVPVQALSEPCPGKARALNRAVRASRGELLAFTDDDCRLHRDHSNDLLRHAAGDTGLVLRGGRIELGDPTDLPQTINTRPTPMRWSRALNSARDEAINGKINGCNMTMRRALLDRVGLFDEDFGPGSRVGSGDDTEFMYRVYVAGVAIDYVPDMTVFHHHGRKTRADGFKLWQRYSLGNGAHIAKYLSKHPDLCRPLYWDIKNAFRELVTGSNTFLPDCGFSHKHKVAYTLRGAIRYFFMRKSRQRGVRSEQTWQ